MKRKEQLRQYYDDFKLNKPFDLHGLCKNISTLDHFQQLADHFQKFYNSAVVDYVLFLTLCHFLTNNE